MIKYEFKFLFYSILDTICILPFNNRATNMKLFASYQPFKSSLF